MMSCFYLGAVSVLYAARLRSMTGLATDSVQVSRIAVAVIG
jgi:hypothetical protein